MNYRSDLYKALRAIFNRPYVDTGFPGKYPKSWHPQTDYNPVNPNKQEHPKLDNSPEAVEERTRSARSSLLVPLAAILGVILILVIAVIVKSHG